MCIIRGNRAISQVYSQETTITRNHNHTKLRQQTIVHVMTAKLDKTEALQLHTLLQEFNRPHIATNQHDSNKQVITRPLGLHQILLHSALGPRAIKSDTTLARVL